jgi:hypothetical protein
MCHISVDEEISFWEFAVSCIVLVDSLCEGGLLFVASHWTQDNFSSLAS